MYEVNNERNADCGLGYDRTLSVATMTFNGGNGAAVDSLRNYKVIRVGDIAFEGHANKAHAYGRFVLNDAGDGLMSPRFSCLRPIIEQRYSFWKYYIPHEDTMRPILVKATKSGTMMNELVPDDLMRESILVPCLAEQEVIGGSLSQLDSLITLHQRKRRKELFTHPLAWEQRKLGDVATITRGERFTAADYVKSDGIPCIHYGEIYTNYSTVATKTISQVKPSLRSSLRYAKPGDVIVATTSENVEDVCKAVAWIGNSLVAYHDDSFALTFSGDPVFLVSFFETSGFYAQKSSVAHGVKVMRVSSDSLANINLPTPLVVEQRLIGSYFSRLDSLITLHQ